MNTIFQKEIIGAVEDATMLQDAYVSVIVNECFRIVHCGNALFFME